MEITYIQVLSGVTILLFGGLIGFQIMKKFGKQELNENQLKLYSEVQNYAKIAYDNLKQQFGNEEILKIQLVQVISTEYPKIDKKILETIISFVFKEANELIDNK